jgi:hypothetical protein
MNCKPGDLAIITRSQTASNVGLIVLVKGGHCPEDTGIITTAQSRQMWHCVAQGSALTYTLGYTVGTEQRRNGPIPDECLRPLRDDEDEQNVRDSTFVPHSGVVYAQQTECC